MRASKARWLLFWVGFSLFFTGSSRGDERAAAAGWGKGCNQELLKSAFALDKAPRFEPTPAQQRRIGEVLAELKRGYGGTLVVSPRDDVLDSAEFLAHYLRAFAWPNDGIHSYNYKFERILDRLVQWPELLKDKRLDWDVWRAYLAYESFSAGEDSFLVDNSRYQLVSAADLLWTFLMVNAKDIRADKARREWWIEQMTRELDAPGGRPLRRWLLLRLVASSDVETAKLIQDRREKDRKQRKETDDEPGGNWEATESDPYYPYMHADSGFPEASKPGPPFREALAELAVSQDLSYEAWEIEAETAPVTKIWLVDLAPRLSQVWIASVIDQESWSNERQDFAVSFSRPIGALTPTHHVHLPARNCDDGVFLFAFKRRLYVWPKASMDDGVIQILHLSGFLDDRSYARFLERGFKTLQRTMSGD